MCKAVPNQEIERTVIKMAKRGQWVVPGYYEKWVYVYDYAGVNDADSGHNLQVRRVRCWFLRAVVCCLPNRSVVVP